MATHSYWYLERITEKNRLEATALQQLFALCDMILRMHTLRNTFHHFRSTLTIFNCVKL